MPRWALIALFLGTVTAVLAALHGYLWLRLVRDLGWPPPWGRALGLGLATLALLVPLGWPLRRLLPPWGAAPVALLLFGWLGVAFLLLVALLGVDLLRATTWAGGRLLVLLGGGDDAPADPARRLLLSRVAAGVAGGTVALVAGAGARAALGDVEVREVPVRLARLPPALAGLSIVQLTDLHVGPTIGRRFIGRVAERAAALRPDVLVITGDLVDGSVDELRDVVAPLAGLRPRFGTFFVTGNHEYYSGPDEWCAALEAMGIRVLGGRRVAIGDAGASFDLAGVDDPTAAGLGGPADGGLARALAGRDPERELVLLAHQPRAIHRAARAGVGLQLSGHTHGGQIWPFGAVVMLQQPYLAGLYQHDEHTQVYVSRGTGYWGPPIRVAAPAEITRIVLTA